MRKLFAACALEAKNSSLWLFIILLWTAYSPTLIYQAVHHDRYHVFYQETMDCTQQYVQQETFRMGRPIGALIDCAMTNLVESLAGYQIMKVLCLLLLTVAFVLLSTTLSRKLSPWERHLLSFLVYALPGFQYTVFMPLAHFILSLIFSLVAAFIYLRSGPWKLRSPAGSSAILCLFLAYISYPAFTAVFLLVLAVEWLLSSSPEGPQARAHLKSGIILYAAGTITYLLLIKVVYKSLDISSSIYSLGFANPLTKGPMLANIVSFSLNHFWFTPYISRLWLVVAYMLVLAIPVSFLIFKAVRRYGWTALRNLFYLSSVLLFLYLAINSAILTTKSGLIVHRTIALGLAFLICLPLIAIHRTLVAKKLANGLALLSFLFAVLVAYVAFNNLQESSRNNLREIAILRDEVGKSLARDIHWVHFNNNFDASKSYIGVPPSMGDEFRTASGWNEGNLEKMIQLAFKDSPIVAQHCFRGDGQVACIRDAVRRGAVAVTQQPVDAQILSQEARLPFSIIDLTSYLIP